MAKTCNKHSNYLLFVYMRLSCFVMRLILFALICYGVYMTFGSGGKGLKDEIREHARMHELGIAHGHEGRHPVMTQRAQEQDYPQHHHDK